MSAVSPARATADILLDIGAVHINAGQPFTLTSCKESPVYIDVRKLIAYLNERRAVTDMAAQLLTQICDLDNVDYIAGGETAGIAYAAFLSEALSKPMLYVRKKPKGFGRGAQIEGDLRKGAKVLLVEDLTTDGGSKIVFADALRDAGGVVADVFSVFFYGIYPQSEKILADAGLRLHYLATWADVLAAARGRQRFAGAALDTVEEYLKDPDGWSLAHSA